LFTQHFAEIFGKYFRTCERKFKVVSLFLPSLISLTTMRLAFKKPLITIKVFYHADFNAINVSPSIVQFKVAVWLLNIGFFSIKSKKYLLNFVSFKVSDFWANVYKKKRVTKWQSLTLRLTFSDLSLIKGMAKPYSCLDLTFFLFSDILWIWKICVPL